MEIRPKHEFTGTAQPPQIPAIIVPVFASDYQQLLSRAIACFGQADIVEWRIDLCAEALGTTPDWPDFGSGGCFRGIIRDLHGSSGAALLATLRTDREGGKATVDDETYAQIVVEASRYAEMVDVEVMRPNADEIVSRVQGNGAIALGSFHDFSGTPSEEELDRVIERMHELCVEVAKVAVRLDTESDLVRLLAAMDKCQMYVLPVGMGPLGAPLRLMGGYFRSVATFATLNGDSTAPGQFDVATVRSVNSVIYGREEADSGWSRHIVKARRHRDYSTRLGG